MKKSIFILFALVFLAGIAMSQENTEKKTPKLPVVDVKTLDGKIVSTSTFSNKGKPIILSFWATWCKPCVTELTTISDIYEDWQTETGVKLIAVSIDDARTTSGVKPFVNGKGWNYEVYLDPNSDLKRAMNVVNVPHTFILNGNGEIVWQHTSYTQGSEQNIINIVKKINAGEPLPKE